MHGRKNSCRFVALFTAILLFLCSLSGCGQVAQEVPSDSISTVNGEEGVTFQDARGNTVTLKSWDRVISLYGSFAEMWTLAGGELIGVTEDAVEERQMTLGEHVEIIGSVKSPNLEAVLALEPDFVILSADIATQVDLESALKEAKVPFAYFRVDTFEDYRSLLERFCTLTGRSDLYEEYGGKVQAKIEAIKALAAEEEHPTGLLIRAFSTGAKAKGTDHQAGVMLEDLGVDNIVSRHESLLEDLSIEEIIEEDPDYIFITTMGSEDAALEALENGIMANPAWSGLTAVQEGHWYVLPKELFHYKPNARWGESYAYLAKLLYPQLTEEVDEIMA